jgi:hypothetical protein
LAQLTKKRLLRRDANRDEFEFSHVLGYQFARRQAVSEGTQDRVTAFVHVHVKWVVDRKPVPVDLVVDHVVTYFGVAITNKASSECLSLFLYRGADFLTSRGRSSSLMRVLIALRDSVLLNGDESNETLRERSACHSRIGDVQIAQGDLSGALASDQVGLEMRESLAKRDPADTQWQRDMFVSSIMLSQICTQLARKVESLSYIKQAELIITRLVKLDPTNLVWQRDFATLQTIKQAILADLQNPDDLPN